MKKLLIVILFLTTVNHAFSQTISPAGTAYFCSGQPQSQLLTVTGGSPTSFQWQLNGVNISGANSSTYTATVIGSYSVILNGSTAAANNLGPVNIQNSVSPTANFSFSSSGQCSNIPVAFTDMSTGANSYLWSFGDAAGTNSTSALQNPSYTFTGVSGNVMQNFTVNYTVANAAGCTASVSKIVSTNQLPNTVLGDGDGNPPVSYQGNQYFKICDDGTNNSFQFTNQSYTTWSNASYLINWGDGTPNYTSTNLPSTTTISHTYANANTPFSYSITGTNGCTGTAQYIAYKGDLPAVGLINPGGTIICAGQPITFPITSTSLNKPETIYTFTVNDGSTPINYTQATIPATITYTFNKTSCGTYSNGIYNSYSAQMVSSNACGSAKAEVVPIYVSEKPVANFTASTNTTVCANTSVVFNNTGKNSFVSGDYCNTGKSVWKISPSTGWTITSGTLGDDKSSTLPATWDAGSITLGINFSLTGTYIVTLKVGTPKCGFDQITKTICVNPSPTVSFTLDKNSGCSPLNVATTTATNALICGANSFLWTVAYAPTTGCSPSTSDFTFLNGTTATSTQPQFQFNSPGIYTIGVTATDALSGCSSTMVTNTVTVKGKPVVNLYGIASATCQNTVIYPTAGISCYIDGTATYAWSFPGGKPATSNVASPGSLVFNAPGNTLIGLAVTNVCGITQVTTPLVIDTAFTITIPTNLVVCSGDNIGPLQFNSSLSATNFSWINNNTSIGLAASGNTNPILAYSSPNITATGTITVAAQKNTCTNSSSFTIQVNAIPAAPVVADTNYCKNAVASALTATATAGNSLRWYNTPSGGTIITNAPTPNTSITGNTTYYVSQISPANCEGARAAINVLIKPIPVIVNGTKTDPTSCLSATGTIALSGLAINSNFMVSYTKDGASAVVISLTSDANGVVLVNNLLAGAYANIFVSLAGCSSNSMGPYILADPQPPATPTINSNSPLCSSNTLLLNSATTSTGSFTYNWSGPSYNSTSKNTSIPNTTVSQSGVYSVVYTQNNCASAAATINVIINQTPDKPVLTANTPLCNGNNLTILSAYAFTGNLIYAWAGPNSFIASTQNININNVTALATGTYGLTITATTGSCAAPISTVAVNVYPTPIITGGNKTDPANCNSATGFIVLNGLMPNASFMVSHKKNSDIAINETIVADAGGAINILNLASGTYSNVFVMLGNCPSNSVGPFILKDPNPPEAPVASSNSPVCIGGTLNLLANNTTTGNISYNWNGPNQFKSTLANPVIAAVPNVANGIYSVTATLNNCTSTAGVITVVVNPPPQLPIVVAVNYCINAVATPLTATNSSGNTLNWYTVATGGSGSLIAPTPSTTVAGSTNFYVSQTNANNCEGSRALLKVMVNPNAIAAMNPPDTIKCAPFTITTVDVGLQQYPNNNSQYYWYVDDVFKGSGINFPGYTITSERSVVTVKLRASSLFGCKDSTVSQKFYTDTLAHPAFTTAVSGTCGPINVTLLNTTPDINRFSYQWDFGDGRTSNAQQPGILTYAQDPNNQDTIYQIKLTAVSTCDISIVQNGVLVKSSPRALFTPVATMGCSPMKAVFKNTSKGVNNTYTWDFGDGSTATTTSLGNVLHTYYANTVQTFTVQLTVVNDCGTDKMSYNIIVSPNNIILDFAMNGVDHAGCAPHQVTFTKTSSGASAFFWDFGDGNILSSVNKNEVVKHTFLNAGTFKVSIKATNECTDSVVFDYVTVFPNPVAAFTAENFTVCKGNSVVFKNQSTIATTYLWDFGDGSTSSEVNPVHNYQISGIYAVKLIAYNLSAQGSICSDSTAKNIYYVSSIEGSFNMSNSIGACVPLSIQFSNNNLPSLTSIWDFKDGTIANGDNVQHTYTTSGIYNVSLTVTVPGGCTYITSKTVTVNGPSGTLNYTGGYNCTGGVVRLEAIASNTNFYQWQFGDGVVLTSNQAIVYHTYPPGKYVPIAVLQNITGCNYPLMGIDTIKVDQVAAGFVTTETKFCDSSTINFSDTSHVFYGKKSVSWDLGDGNKATGVQVMHTYRATGIYTIKMIVLGISGCADTVYQQLNIHISNKPIVSIKADDVLCSNQPEVFTANIQSTDALNILKWDLSNGITGYGGSLNYAFPIPGTYTARFIGGTINGCFDTAYHIITIKLSPVITASAGITLCKGASTQLNAYGGTVYQWSPIQGLSCTNCSNPVATPLFTTPYLVQGTNLVGCKGYDTVVLVVVQPIQITVTGRDTICIGQSTNLTVTGGYTYKWSPVLGLSDPAIFNPVATPALSTLYTVVGYDAYNCFTDTGYRMVVVGQYPIINLGPDKVLSTGMTYPLTTSITNGPIVSWQWTPDLNIDCTNCSQPNALIKTDIAYTVNGINEYGCAGSDTIGIKVFCANTQVFVANGFTPDGDGINDILMVRAQGITMVKTFKVFSRWGEIVFEKSNFPPNIPSMGWDGKIKGKVGPAEVYVYIAEVVCDNGVSYTYKGNTTILK